MLRKINRKISSLQSLITDWIGAAITSPTLLISLFVVRHRFSRVLPWEQFGNLQFATSLKSVCLVLIQVEAWFSRPPERPRDFTGSSLVPKIPQSRLLQQLYIDKGVSSIMSSQNTITRASHNTKKPVLMSSLSELSTALVNLNILFPCHLEKSFEIID